MVACEIDTEEPRTVKEAMRCQDSEKWKKAMQEEMDSLAENKT